MNEKAIDIGPVERLLAGVPDWAFAAMIARRSHTFDFIEILHCSPSANRDAGKQTAVYKVVSASAERSGRRAEKSDEFRNLFRRANSPNRMRLSKALKNLFNRQFWRKSSRSEFEHRRPD